MFDTIMQYVTSLGMLTAAILMGIALYRDEIAFRRWEAEIKRRAKETYEEHKRNKRD